MNRRGAARGGGAPRPAKEDPAMNNLSTRRTPVLAAALLAALLAALVLAIPPAKAEGAIYLSKKQINLSCNHSFQLEATLMPAPVPPEVVVITWTSTKPAVATVDENGLVTAGDQVGVARIRAVTNDGRSAVCTVRTKLVRVNKVELSGEDLLLEVGQSLTLTAVIKPEDASIRQVTWSSGNPQVASVDENGLVSALSPGQAVITAKAGAKSAKCKITIPGEPEPTPQPGTGRSITITAVGDVTVGGDPRRAASLTASQAHYERLYQANGGKFFKNVDRYFSGSDELTLINLESNFTTGTSYKNKTYVFRAKPAYAHILSDAGVDVVGHANNHAYDISGAVSKTRSAVRAHGMAYVGNGVTATVTKNKVRVGFCAYSYTNMSAAQIRSTVKRLAKQCDLVVVSLHWGKEYVYSVSASQRSLARSLITAGADLVVGHHSHVVSGIEKYKDRYIVYSLGNFSSAILTPQDMDTMIYRQTFILDDSTGKITVQPPDVIPCSMSSAAKNNATPVVLKGADKQRVIKKINRYSTNFSL